MPALRVFFQYPGVCISLLIAGIAKGISTMPPISSLIELKVKGPTRSLDTDWATKESPQMNDVSSKSRAAFLSFITAQDCSTTRVFLRISFFFCLWRQRRKIFRKVLCEFFVDNPEKVKQ